MTSLPVRLPTSLPTLGPFGRTMRRDRWWLQPLSVFVGLSVCGAYVTWAAYQGEYYTFDNYLSPFYPPELLGIEVRPRSALDGRTPGEDIFLGGQRGARRGRPTPGRCGFSCARHSGHRQYHRGLRRT